MNEKGFVERTQVKEIICLVNTKEKKAKLYRKYFVIGIIFVMIYSTLFSPLMIISADEYPTVILLSPLQGSIIKKSVLVSWEAFDSKDDSLQIYIYCNNQAEDTWFRIHDQALDNTGEYVWDCSDLSDGHYFLKIEAMNSEKKLGIDNSGLIHIDNDNSNLRISKTSIVNLDTGSNKYVRNGDTLRITATIVNGNHIIREQITADLNCFGLDLVIPDMFDGSVATWDILFVSCQIKDGLVSIFFNLDFLDQSTLEITVDNTEPIVNVSSPVGGLYVFSKKIIPLKSTFIIGKIPLTIQVDDNFGISYVRVNLDGILYETLYDGPYELKINKRLVGTHRLTINVEDFAGNIVSQTFSFRVFNFMSIF